LTSILRIGTSGSKASPRRFMLRSPVIQHLFEGLAAPAHFLAQLGLDVRVQHDGCSHDAS
jgi:hypothetical protein